LLAHSLFHTLEEQLPGFIHELSTEILALGGARRWPGTETVFNRITGRPFAAYYAQYLRTWRSPSTSPWPAAISLTEPRDVHQAPWGGGRRRAPSSSGFR
jgi:hypothetical protein